MKASTTTLIEYFEEVIASGPVHGPGACRTWALSHAHESLARLYLWRAILDTATQAELEDGTLARLHLWSVYDILQLGDPRYGVLRDLLASMGLDLDTQRAAGAVAEDPVGVHGSADRTPL